MTGLQVSCNWYLLSQIYIFPCGGTIGCSRLHSSCELHSPIASFQTLRRSQRYPLKFCRFGIGPSPVSQQICQERKPIRPTGSANLYRSGANLDCPCLGGPSQLSCESNNRTSVNKSIQLLVESTIFTKMRLDYKISRRFEECRSN